MGLPFSVILIYKLLCAISQCELLLCLSSSTWSQSPFKHSFLQSYVCMNPFGIHSLNYYSNICHVKFLSEELRDNALKMLVFPGFVDMLFPFPIIYAAWRILLVEHFTL